MVQHLQCVPMVLEYGLRIGLDLSKVNHYSFVGAKYSEL